ncbi:hypothetical protein HY031_02440 [Candidatus Gottesmanbacteria bacterium]|nr:hypothetical protein [Candidatus Gottesmanbacteria bacterium]
MGSLERRSAISTLLHPKATFAQEVPSLLFDLTISENTWGRMKTLQDILRDKNTPWNVIFYSNHTAFGDPAMWVYVARTVDPEATRPLAVLASDYHTTFKNNPVFASCARVGASLAGIQLIPVIQTYMIDDPKYGYSPGDSRKNSEDIIRTIQKIKKPLMLLVSPEGHRSDDGKLGNVESGFVSLGRRLVPTLYVPVGISYEGTFRRSGLNTRLSQNYPRVHIEMGDITAQRAKMDKPSLQELMYNLAQTLPSELQGRWQVPRGRSPSTSALS